MISGTANGHVPFTQTDCAGWVGEIRMKKRIISVVLSMLMMLGTVPYAVTAAGGGTDEYPELMISTAAEKMPQIRIRNTTRMPATIRMPMFMNSFPFTTIRTENSMFTIT